MVIANDITKWFTDNRIEYEVCVEFAKELTRNKFDCAYTEYSAIIFLCFFNESDAALFKLTWYSDIDA